MPAENHTIVFEVVSKTIRQVPSSDAEGNPTIVEITSVTFVPTDDEPINVVGSFIINLADASMYELGTKYEATFVERVDAPAPPVV